MQHPQAGLLWPEERGDKHWIQRRQTGAGADRHAACDRHLHDLVLPTGCAGERLPDAEAVELGEVGHQPPAGPQRRGCSDQH